MSNEDALLKVRIVKRLNNLAVYYGNVETSIYNKVALVNFCFEMYMLDVVTLNFFEDFVAWVVPERMEDLCGMTMTEYRNRRNAINEK